MIPIKPLSRANTTPSRLESLAPPAVLVRINVPYVGTHFQQSAAPARVDALGEDVCQLLL
jgi:hypothetical protein